MSSGGARQDLSGEQQTLLSSLQRREQSLQNLQRELEDIRRVLALLEEKQHQDYAHDQIPGQRVAEALKG